MRPGSAPEFEYQPPSHERTLVVNDGATPKWSSVRENLIWQETALSSYTDPLDFLTPAEVEDLPDLDFPVPDQDVIPEMIFENEENPVNFEPHQTQPFETNPINIRQNSLQEGLHNVPASVQVNSIPTMSHRSHTFQPLSDPSPSPLSLSMPNPLISRAIPQYSHQRRAQQSPSSSLSTLLHASKATPSSRSGPARNLVENRSQGPAPAKTEEAPRLPETDLGLPERQDRVSGPSSASNAIAPLIPIQSCIIAHARSGVVSMAAVQERRMKNTESARRSRARRADKLSILREQNEELMAYNEKLVAENERLRHIVGVLEASMVKTE